jgi:AmmeMemoRadiSam system protein B
MSTSDSLFDSMTEPVPPLRRDLDMIPVQHKGQTFMVAHDSMGYVPEGFALPAEAVDLLQVFNGRITLAQLLQQLKQQPSGVGLTEDQLRQFVRQLDENRLLHSSYFKEFAEDIELAFEQAEVRQPSSAGVSYPEEEEALIAHLDELFDKHGNGRNGSAEKDIKALYAPHIDPRIGARSYVQAFERLRGLQPKRVVLIATSHYSGLHPDVYDQKPFITSRKTFAMPHGDVPVDHHALDQLEQQADELGISFQDRAHRIEHSIELHLLYLRYLWAHEFELVPILVGGFQDLLYMRDGHTGTYLDRFSGWMREQFADDDETFFLISGDLAHIGQKFGDAAPAQEMLDSVKQFDERFLQLAGENNRSDLLSHMQEEYDPYRICGFPPLLTFLETMPEVKGEQLTYQVWDERERNSAVTFGSLLYRK